MAIIRKLRVPTLTIIIIKFEIKEIIIEMNKTLIFIMAALVSQATASRLPDDMPAKYDCESIDFVFQKKKCVNERLDWLD